MIYGRKSNKRKQRFGRRSLAFVELLRNCRTFARQSQPERGRDDVGQNNQIQNTDVGQALAPIPIDTSTRLFTKTLCFLLSARQWPNTPQKALHKRNAHDKDDNRADGGKDHMGPHRSPFQALRQVGPTWHAAA
jgi:hypothetical protein